MEFSRKGISCAEAREIDIVGYLSALAIEPVKIRGFDYWYLSPLRDEKTASFKVNRRLNRWYDFGIGEGGNLIDLAIRLHCCTVGEFLTKLSGDLSFQQPIKTVQDFKLAGEAENPVSIIEVKSIAHPALLDYLSKRRIPPKVANAFCKEVQGEIKGKQYFAIGFPNDEGGWELRNPYFKSSSSPKAITTIRSKGETLTVFEGFFDFLSLKTITGENLYESDFLILNSLSFFERSLPLMLRYPKIYLFLDNDEAGQNCSRMACTASDRFIDRSGLYKNYKDFNEMLCHAGDSMEAFSAFSFQPP